MTTQEWLAIAKDNAEVLWSLIRRYHPVSIAKNPRGDVRISAPLAEAACENIRQEIIREDKGDPVHQFNCALESNDIWTLNTLLNEAWFGVPETTDCWRITGFAEAVELMEDLPREGE